MIQLIRLPQRRDCTFGVILIDNEPVSASLELPWRGNDQNVSCIPIGHYLAKRRKHPTFGDCLQLFDLQGREPAERGGILVHSGNTVRDTRGCILPGLQFGRIGEDSAVLNSKRAMTNILAKLGSINEVDFLITEA